MLQRELGVCMNKYILDANIFIQAKNLHYGFAFCPAFWDWIIEKNVEEKVYSIDKIYDELVAGEDELSDWVKNQNTLFLPTNAEVLPYLAPVSLWASTNTFDQVAVSTFLQVADYYLIAHGLAHNYIIVTHEVPANTLKRIKIPNACIGLNIKFMNPYTMLRNEKAKFILGI